MTRKNPWRGLASYEEPQGNEQDYLFCGRDEETLDMVRLIENNLFVTLYGSSGIGKTSLLKAGVIPILRRKDYFPLYVRLSQEDNNISYAEAIVNKLRNSGLHEERGAALDHADGNDRLYLWSYFATTRFRNSDGREVYPVIILDQFEEVFRDADKRKAELLLKQIYLLLNDELEMPAADGYSADTNYRFVASIREDFLFVLEDSIDENSLDLYKNNRYRLRPMKPENARQVVLVPGKDCIEENKKESIANLVISIVKRNSNNSIDTLILSLFCSEMYNVAMHKHSIITESLIEQIRDDIFSSFYDTCMLSVSPITVNYIETHLLTQSGYRNSIALEDILHDGINNEDINTLIEKHLLRIEHSKGIERIEFSHDAICYMAKNSREKHAFENKQKQEISHNIGFIFDLGLPLFSLCLLLISKDWQNCQFKDILLLLVLLFAACIVFPYRHTKDRNSFWFSLVTWLCWYRITYYLFVDSFGFLIMMVDKTIINTILLGGALYNIHVFYSLSFKKKRSLKEAIKYIIQLQIYKEHPKFKIILLIIFSVLILLLALSYILMINN